jgi:hypothetical protein
MRVAIAVAAAVLGLSACGGGFGRPSDKQALVADCIEDGEAEATCTCIADALEAKLEPELFQKVAQAVGRENQDMLEYMSGLPAEELMAYSAVTNDFVTCSQAAASGG